ncbi:hypothetical protein CWS35_16275 [Bradyrhizobium sp. SK17]|jgi:hypothetical protein|uniref:hypothetical protein n=1 Tax=Bradyrhizobium sp. SK17 TaxID=2057741 RepID=UPI000C308378|nr:hypothetical protein [Bradyrhizobium sp. SK17]AUC95615.1 hypothetical protein CWS35_16275 [Bradyrhizobium sp. SK17]
MTIAGFRLNTVISFVLLLFMVSLGACNEESEPPKWKTVVVKEQTKLPEWLTIKDRVDPAVWLRSREVGHEVLPTDPEVDRLRRALGQARTRFVEDERMIANRTAQTSDMLAEARQPERVVDTMTGLIDVADTTPNRKLYGDMCQQYLNMRKSGADRTEALQRLTESYKDQDDLR